MKQAIWGIQVKIKLFFKRLLNNLLWSVYGCSPPDKVNNLVDWVGRNPTKATFLEISENLDLSWEGEALSTEAVDNEYSSNVFLKQEHFIANIKNGRAIRHSGDIIAPDNTLLAEGRGGLTLLLGRLPPVQRVAGRVAVLTNGPCRNYYHWMIDVLPLLALLRLSNLKPDKYFVRYDLPFQRETLSMLGIGQDRILPANRYSHIEADELLVPSRRVSHVLAYPFLRQSFGSEPSAARPRSRIYVSRANASKRRVRNEAEVVRMLVEYGFEAIELSGMSVRQQAEIFQSAEFIVGPHGAGFSNVVFCQKGATLIELYEGHPLPHYFIDICRNIGIEHFQFKKTRYAPQRLSTLFRKDRDFFVDVEELRTVLFEFLKSGKVIPPEISGV
jgi:hypothetical protein